MSQFFTSDGQSIGGLSFSISPSNEYSGLTSLRMDWLYLLVVQGTLKSLHQHQSSKTSILWHSALFIVQLSHPYMTTGKTIALTRQMFVRKVMSLLFNMLSRLVIAFLPRSKHLIFFSFLNFLKYKFIYFNWILITLQYCIGFTIINMNLPWVYTCSPSWTPLPPPSPYHPSWL